MADIQITDITGVETCLKNFVNAYNDFVNELKSANQTFNKLNDYWRGTTYIQVMSTWNTNVDVMNKYASGICVRSKTQNKTLFDFLNLDRGSATLIKVSEPTKLTHNEIDKDKNKITTETSKLRTDLSELKTYLDKALSSIKTMSKNSAKAPWSDKGGRIDADKAENQAELNFFQTQLETLRTDINDELTKIASAFETTDKKA